MITAVHAVGNERFISDIWEGGPEVPLPPTGLLSASMPRNSMCTVPERNDINTMNVENSCHVNTEFAVK